MGIAPYKTFTFDGVSSSTYGVYLTGKGVFNAPERAVEMLDIPGRNGNYALDQGRFNNLTVTYRVGMYDTTEANFATKVSNFRNWLCSKVGYCRLEDEYNPNEYRMAVYMSGLDLEHDLLIAGEATITFECKPQRWLTSGETATAVANNGTLSNPTLFDSEPLLAVKGYGTIGFNGYEVEIVDEEMGEVLLVNEWTASTSGLSLTLAENIMNNGDSFITYPSSFYWSIVPRGYTKSVTISSVTDSNPDAQTVQGGSGYYIKVPGLQGVYGTAATLFTNVSTITGSYVAYDDTVNNFTMTVTTEVAYSIYNNVHRYMFLLRNSGLPTALDTNYSSPSTLGKMIGDSTVSILGNPTYIDCDIGTAYKIVNNEIVDLNSYIELGSDLPKLSVGTNKFTYDNTVTELKVAPRWWKV